MMRKLFQQLKNRLPIVFWLWAGDGPELSPLLKTPPWESSQPGSASPSSLAAAIVVSSSSTSNSSPDLAPCMVLEGIFSACSKYSEMLLKSKFASFDIFVCVFVWGHVCVVYMSICVFACVCVCVSECMNVLVRSRDWHLVHVLLSSSINLVTCGQWQAINGTQLRKKLSESSL